MKNATTNQTASIEINSNSAIAPHSSEHPGTLHLTHPHDPLLLNELIPSDAAYCDAMQDYMSRHI
ncbi:hypothetical protein H6F67_05075 [Microcoleus sp. FACHB-1515]|uniref:hypothetical protein n=1 Tax=Cyanophyceae TaxID=3028117 RepID=UPI0016862A1C|nr:hypothetical protein [Microcoleus sp. FACHB-1515]MBD2089223.1 hypothetical protein [Microcoleus sp. FACHB-1515]